MFFDERAIETSELLHRRMSEGAVARIRVELAGTGETDCIDCGDPIPAARRAALPSAERCIRCQTNAERRWR